jgi:hypothetical protein
MGGMKDTLGDQPYGDLFSAKAPTIPPAAHAYNGPEYQPSRDYARLAGQTLAVYNAVKDGQWRTLDQIATMADAPVASVSAQLRHLRKPKFGSHVIERRHVANGLFEYRMTA